MQFTNSTGLPGAFLAGSTSDREQVGMVACKVTYRLTAQGGLEPLPVDQMWPVYGEPAAYGGVQLAGELDYRKQDIDILVFGQAMAAGAKATTRMRLNVVCGPVNLDVAVIGDRRWEKALGRVYISEPLPFLTMPITNDRAFGGKGLLDGVEVVHAVNPDGRGYCGGKDDVEGKLLPNLERASALLTTWQQSPPPACLYKPKGVLLDASGPGSFQELSAAADPMALSRAMIASMFHQTVPELVCPTGKLGRTLRLSGFDVAGDVVFPLPPERAVPGQAGPTVHVSTGGIASRFPLSIATVIALAPERVLVVTYLGLFRYLFRPEELRRCELRWHGAVSVPPPAPEPRRSGR